LPALLGQARDKPAGKIPIPRSMAARLACVQGRHAFTERRLLVRLLELLKHPDHDVHERAILALISLGSQGEARRLLRVVGGEKVGFLSFLFCVCMCA